MKKNKKTNELRDGYSGEDLKGGVRGMFFKEFSRSTNLVRLNPEVKKVFPTEKSVNDALLSLNDIARKTTKKKGRPASSTGKKTG